MEEGPFRASRPAERRAVSRPEPAYRQPDEPVRPEPQQTVEPTPSARHSKKETKPSKRFRLPLIIALVIVLGVVGWLVWSGTHKSATTAIDTSKYQAVFFTNGQVYFGKLSPLSDESMKLTDIYYLQTPSSSTDKANPQQTSTDQSNVQLIKLGSEIHGPEDEMIISKQQVLFYENLKTDGKVAQSIASYQKSH